MFTPASASLRRASFTLLAALATLSPLSAAVLTWDPANTANGATIDTGSGTWNLVAGNTVWNNAGVNEVWSQGTGTTAVHSAQFAGVDAPEGTTYTVTLAASVNVVSPLRFANSGYVLTAAAGSSHVVSTPQIVTNSGKTSTLSGPIAVRPTAGFTFGGYGTVTLKDGVSVSTPGSNNLTFSNGSKLRLQTGGAVASAGSMIVGSLNNDATVTQITVEGGSLRSIGTGSTAFAIILANASAPAAGTASLGSVLTLSSGEVSVASPTGGIRFGAGGTAGNAAITGTLNLDGGVLTAARLYEGAGAATPSVSILNLNGGTLQALANTANGATFLANLDFANVKAGGAVVDSNGANITIGQALLADATSTGGGLTKLGAGTLTLTGANTYTGATAISAGKLAINAPYSAITATSVATGARLQIVSGPTASSLPALTLASEAGVELNLGAYNGANLATASVASLTANADYRIDLTGTNIPVGAYTVFTYGQKTGAGLPVVGAMPPGITASVQDTGSAIVLTVSSPQLPSFVWSAGSGTWDTVAANWTGQTYIEGGLATFPQIAGDNTVTLSAPRSPFSITIQNAYSATAGANSTYTFSGAAIAGSGSLEKTGTGVVTFNTSNSYSGPTTIGGGLILVSADAAFGSASGGTALASGSSLGLTGGVGYTTAEPLTVNGNGYDTTIDSATLVRLRGVIQSVSGNSLFGGPIALGAGVARIGTQNGAALTLAGTISPAAGVTDSGIYFRAGNNSGDFITLSGSGNQWTANSVIYTNCEIGAAGVRLGANNALATGASVLAGGTFASIGTTLDLNGFNQTLPGLTQSEGNLRIANLKSGSVSVLTLDTAAADFTNQAAPTNTENEFTLVSDGVGTVSVVKKGAFKQTLDGVHSYTGATSIEAGTLAFAGAGSLGATPVALASGATLDVSAITAANFALGAGLSGSGTITATGKTVTVSSSFAPRALTVAGDLVLAAGTASTFVAAASPAASTALAVSGNLTLAGALAIDKAPGFDFSTGQNFAFATGTIVPGLSGVTVNGVALTESAADVWTATLSGLDYTFTEATATLSVSGGVAISQIQAWRNLYFPGAGNDGTGIGAPSADPDADGIANLLEYATHTSPVAANAPAVTPRVQGGRLTLTFTRIDDPTLRYTVVGRDDLVTGNWANVTPAAGNNPTSGFAGSAPATTETVQETVVDSVSIASQPRRFLRLQVDVQP